jgi:hypothetical protein
MSEVSGPHDGDALAPCHQLRCSRSQSRLRASEYLEWICRSAWNTCGNLPDQCSDLEFLRLLVLVGVEPRRTSCGLSADSDLSTWPAQKAGPPRATDSTAVPRPTPKTRRCEGTNRVQHSDAGRPGVPAVRASGGRSGNRTRPHRVRIRRTYADRRLGDSRRLRALTRLVRKARRDAFDLGRLNAQAEAEGVLSRSFARVAKIPADSTTARLAGDLHMSCMVLRFRGKWNAVAARADGERPSPYLFGARPAVWRLAVDPRPGGGSAGRCANMPPGDLAVHALVDEPGAYPHGDGGRDPGDGSRSSQSPIHRDP